MPEIETGTPDEEDTVGPIVTTVRGILPAGVVPGSPVDISEINDTLAGVLPTGLLELTDLSAGQIGCLPAVFGPRVVNNSMEVKGSGAVACNKNMASLWMAISIEVKVAGKWSEIDGSVRIAENTGEDYIEKKTRGYCKPGTYKYRMRLLMKAVSNAGGSQITEMKGSPNELTCRTFL